ncbi:sulfotransferase [Ilyomonas limi]|uniref:Sulfotransferase n=1 Tax=Ilyomonas limi TaxID=2575867 RepID=A0A4U3KZS6_9BACT|nr:sulfotransferase [Ilyomonas limi]TKK67399.1 sulfotransferase [Ilyomonas limi]
MSVEQSPLFVCGFPSGGTDLTKNILNAHPKIDISGEMPFIYYLYKYGYSADTTFNDLNGIEVFRDLMKKMDRWNNLKNINYSSYQYPVSIQHVLHSWFTSEGVSIWGNKTPQNSENIDNLLKIFPKCKLIIVVRDIRDVSLSWKRKWGKDYLLCAHKWQARMSKAYQMLQKLPEDQYSILRYEDFVSDVEFFSKKICEFLNIEWSSNMLNYQLHLQERIEGKINYGERIISNNFNKWKNELNNREVKRIEEIAFNTLKLFSYEVQVATKQVPLTTFEKMTGLINDIGAIIGHGNKFNNNNSIVKRMKTLAGDIRQNLLKAKQ